MYIIAYFGLFTASFFLLTYFGNKREVKSDPIAKKFPFVSIVINVWNEEKAIAKTIKSVLSLNYPKNKYEIIVVDDGSTDRTYERAKAFSGSLPRVRVLRKKNGGAASAKNFGIKYAKGEIIATLDADSFVTKDALKKMVGYFEDKDVYSVTAALNVYKPKGFLHNLQWAEYVMGIFLRKIFSLTDALHVIPGPFSLFRKKFFDKYGDFDEGNITEDTEIAMRIQTKGYKIKNSISANVYTILPNSYWGLMKQRIRWYYGFLNNSWHYKNLFNPFERRDNLSILILPAALISVVLAILTIFIFVYENIALLQDNVIRLIVTDFDILSSLLSIDWAFIRESIISYIFNPFIAFIVMGVICAGVLITMGKKESLEKRNMFWAFLSFFLTYWFFYASWWIGTFIYRGVLRKKIKWGPRYY